MYDDQQTGYSLKRLQVGKGTLHVPAKAPLF